MSKMMNRSGNLSEDQIFLAAKYLGLEMHEADFLLMLRAASATELEDRREHILRQIAEIRKSMEVVVASPLDQRSEERVVED